MTIRKCTYIGLGNMGLAVYKATHKYFLANGWKIEAIDLNPQRTINITTDDIKLAQTPPERSTVTFIGVHPQDFINLREHSHKVDIVVSMMAGISVDTIKTVFPGSRIIRIIPNTPCAFGVGITPIYTDFNSLKDTTTASVLTALSRLGPLMPVLDEPMINCATGISAGGPAYIMLIAEAMISTAEEMGFEPAESRQLVAHTLLGSAELLIQTSKSPRELAQEVMTPNGTTERGVSELQRRDIGNSFRTALLNASKRATDIARESRNQK